MSEENTYRTRIQCLNELLDITEQQKMWQYNIIRQGTKWRKYFPTDKNSHSKYQEELDTYYKRIYSVCKDIVEK